MSDKIQDLLRNNYKNHVLPFLWLHGEDEEILRKYIQVISECSIGAVCVESRPHPDFCGPKWWGDLSIILDEARKYSMQVWILDDSHFPTGYANGAMKNAPEELSRQGICYYGKKLKGRKKEVRINVNKFLNKKNDYSSILSIAFNKANQPMVFSEDYIFSITAIHKKNSGDIQIDLMPYFEDGVLTWNKPEGEFLLSICKISRNCGFHRDYINMMDEQSCRLLIDAVYEPHYEHFGSDFGQTIAGFFSDEPELGNGRMFDFKNALGTNQDLPWSKELEKSLESELGSDWKNKLPYLWENELDSNMTASIRYIFMNAVTRKVEKTFSQQIGNWCREHNIESIGHIIEDNNQHARTGSSLGHYFRGLSGQDMAGIDVVTRQIMPQSENNNKKVFKMFKWDSEFFHYVLGKLGSSLAAIDSPKKGRALCEIFGNYGWAEGLRIEKYLTDHLLVRGINYFVPHAFSAKDYPDSDCPPHFYAHGHNPQYKHFGYLMRYMNRVSDLLSGGRHISPVAILYHAEAEWTGKRMLMQKPARVLLDRQIDFDIIPMDVFMDIERYNPNLNEGFKVNNQEYKAFVIPYAQYISKHLVKAIEKLIKNSISVIFIDALPDGIFDGDNSMIKKLDECSIVTLDKLIDFLEEEKIPEIKISPSNKRIRYLHYKSNEDIFFFTNEGTVKYKGKVLIPIKGEVYAYNAWDNQLEQIEYSIQNNEVSVELDIEPNKSMIIVFGEINKSLLKTPKEKFENESQELQFTSAWKRSICKSMEYPNFGESKEVLIPDNLAKEIKNFSGYIKYENTFKIEKKSKAIVFIADAYEGVEVFINEKSAGVQIVPKFRFDISKLLIEGENHIAIEVATTLERERTYAKNKTFMEKMKTDSKLAPIGITGDVKILFETKDK